MKKNITLLMRNVGTYAILPTLALNILNIHSCVAMDSTRQEMLKNQETLERIGERTEDFANNARGFADDTRALTQRLKDRNKSIFPDFGWGRPSITTQETASSASQKSSPQARPETGPETRSREGSPVLHPSHAIELAATESMLGGLSFLLSNELRLHQGDTVVQDVITKTNSAIIDIISRFYTEYVSKRSLYQKMTRTQSEGPDESLPDPLTLNSINTIASEIDVIGHTIQTLIYMNHTVQCMIALDGTNKDHDRHLNSIKKIISKAIQELKFIKENRSVAR